MALLNSQPASPTPPGGVDNYLDEKNEEDPEIGLDMPIEFDIRDIEDEANVTVEEEAADEGVTA